MPLMNLDSLDTGTVSRKLIPPTLHGGLMERPVVMHRLERLHGYRITVLHAPAGYGKSCALRLFHDLLEQRGEKVCWVTLDETDADIPRLLLLLRKVFFKQPTARVRLTDVPPCTLFLDDLNRLPTASAAQIFNILLDVLPMHVRLVVGTRILRGSGLAAFKAARIMASLDIADLRFTREEVERYFHLHTAAQSVTSHMLDLLFEKTEGWPAVLQLITCAQEKLPAPGYLQSMLESTALRQDLTQYLVEEIVDLQTPQIQRFLLETAGLDKIHADLCDYLRNATDSDALISQIMTNGLPVQVEQEGWYRYHPLLAEQLRRIAHQKTAVQTTLLNQRCAQWFAARQRVYEAISCWLAAQDFEQAACAMGAAAKTLMLMARYSTVIEWCRQLPERILKKNIHLYCTYWVCLLFTNQLKQAIVVQRDLQRAEKSGLLSQSIKNTLRFFELLIAHYAYYTQHARFDLHKAQQDALQYLHAMEESDSLNRGRLCNLVAMTELASGEFVAAQNHMLLARRYHRKKENAQGLATVIYLESCALAIKGNLQEAIAHLIMIDSIGAASRREIPPGFLHLFSVGFNLQLKYELGQFDEARVWLGQYRHLAMRYTLPSSMFLLTLIESRLAFVDQGRAAAVRVMESFSLRFPREAFIQILVELELARIAIVCGNWEQVRAYSDLVLHPQWGPEAWDWVHPNEEQEGAGIAHVRLMLYAGEDWLARGMDWLEKMIAHARSQQRPWRLTRLLILSAVARQLAGAADQALAALQEAVTLAAESGAISSFFDEGPEVGRLLQTLAERPLKTRTAAVTAHLNKLLLYAAQREPAQEPRLQEALSQREREILRLVAAGLSNKKIAEQTDLSGNTVKWHLSAIYSKLMVSTRLQAVTEAGKLGWL